MAALALAGVANPLQCCGQTVVMPSHLAAASGGGDTLADLLLPLTCRQNHTAPEAAALPDRPDGLSAPYRNPPWQLRLPRRTPAEVSATAIASR